MNLNSEERNLLSAFSKYPLNNEKIIEQIKTDFDHEAESVLELNKQLYTFLFNNNEVLKHICKRYKNKPHQQIAEYLRIIHGNMDALNNFNGPFNSINLNVEFDTVTFRRSDNNISNLLTIRELFKVPDNGFLEIWNDDMISKFLNGLDMLAINPIFFFSYTNNNPDAVNLLVKSVDNGYIEKKLNIPKLNASNKQLNASFEQPEKSNKLATHLIYWLKHHLSISGSSYGDKFRICQEYFYDKDHIDNAEDWKKKILPACQNSFTLVQLIHDEILNIPVDLNWPYKEYSAFKKIHDPSRIFFITLDFEPDTSLNTYRDWMIDIKDFHHTKLYSSSFDASKDNECINWLRYSTLKLAKDINLKHKHLIVNYYNSLLSN